MEKQSRYVVKAKSNDGQSTIFYNLKTAKGIKVANVFGTTFRELMELAPLRTLFAKQQFLASDDEQQLIKERYKQQQSEAFHLVIMPHQNCNFRCIYCYEKFEKNKMTRDVERGLIALVEQRLAKRTYKVLMVSWFGGEPLLAPDVIERLSVAFREICQMYGVRYVAGITTNGYMMTDERIQLLMEQKVRHFQITIDGVKEVHDKQRVLQGGQGTYEQILANMTRLKDRTERFTVLIRMNVSPDNLRDVEAHIAEMKRRFGDDDRFELYFQNIGHWGGENDPNVEICADNVTLTLLKKAMDRDMKVTKAEQFIAPHSSCYAANPHSLVVGVDGMLYKCTVALYSEFNHVGQLQRDGTTVIDEQKFKLWTESAVGDAQCQSCFFAPSCQGESCPLVRIEKNERPCPSTKLQAKQFVQLMDRQGYAFTEVKQRQLEEV